jgi:hypothetical protein
MNGQAMIENDKRELTLLALFYHVGYNTTGIT